MDTHSPKDSNLKEIQRAYWCALNKVLDEVGGPIRGDKMRRSWFVGPFEGQIKVGKSRLRW